MKTIKLLSAFLITFAAINIFPQASIAQKNSDKEDAKKMVIKNMIDSQHFVFEAQSVLSFRGRFRNLTSPYNVTVQKDSMVSSLPYFGRAYNPPMNPSDIGLDFTSTNFSYVVSPQKKNGWNVTIKPKDKTEIRQYVFTIFDNGKASLQVQSTSRDPISFNGYVETSTK
jgi:hypothetical protein